MNMDVNSIKNFSNQNEDFVADWLRQNGLEKLVEIFKGTVLYVYLYFKLWAIFVINFLSE